jgi:hypothetical protein
LTPTSHFKESFVHRPLPRRAFLVTLAATGAALATDKAGGCPLFAGKQVAGAGWCSAWAKKA